MYKAEFARAFWEAGLVTWTGLAVLMFVSRGNMGLLGVAAILFPGVWGALRLQKPAGGVRRLVCYLAFSLGQGVFSFAVVVGADFVLRFLGLQRGESEGELGVLLIIMLSPMAAFLVVRGSMALPSTLRRLSWRAVLLFGVTAAALVVIGIGVYAWMSQPYAGHAAFSEPRVLSSSLLAGFDRIEDWRVSDPLVRLQSENGILHLDSASSPNLFYTMTWQIKPGTLSSADGLRLRAHSDAPLSFLVELEETGGAKYRTWVDLPSGDSKSLLVADFLPFLQIRDENGKLDWEAVGAITFYTLLDKAGPNLWLEQMEGVQLDHSTERAWSVTTSDHFWIRYHPSEQAVAADVQRAAESQFERVASGLGFRPHGLIPITIVSDHAELEQRQRAMKPAWAYANAFPDSLDILTPRLYSPFFNGHRYEDILKLVPHELVHVFNYQIVGYPGIRIMPTWLNEGLAIYFGGQESDEKALVQAAHQGALIPFKELDKPFREQSNPALSYAMAKSLTGFLIETYGGEKNRLLMGQLARGVDFNAALEFVCGIDQATFERHWREHLLNSSQ